MSSTVRTSLRRARSSAVVLTRCTCGVEKCGAGDEQRLRLREKILRDVVFRHRHVRAVLAVEDQRERVAVLDAEHDGRGEPRRVDAHVRYVAAFARERLGEEAAHGVVADARRHRRREAEARATERSVGRRAAEVLREARDVLEPRADLLRVEIDRKAAEADRRRSDGRRQSGCCSSSERKRPAAGGASRPPRYR